MDFEKTLKKFAQSGVSRRQIRENAHFALKIEIENESIEAEVYDLSRGGIAVALAEQFVVDTPVVLQMKWIGEDDDIETKVPAYVTWVRTEDNRLMVGFAFESLAKDLEDPIEHVLLDHINKRTM